MGVFMKKNHSSEIDFPGIGRKRSHNIMHHDLDMRECKTA